MQPNVTSDEPNDDSKRPNEEVRDQILATHLASGKTITAAAELAGVHRMTVHRRLQDPAFRARVKALLSEQLDRTMSHLVDAGVDAVVTLRHVMAAGACQECGRTSSPASQVAAARTILDHLGIGEIASEDEDLKGCVEDRVRKEAQELFERKMAYERRMQNSERP